MKPFLAILFAMFTLTYGCGQVTSPQGQTSEVAIKYPIQDSDGIVLVCHRVGIESSWGTGFIVSYKNKDVLVTAAHVVDDPKGVLQLYYPDGKPIPFVAVRAFKDVENDAAMFVLQGLPANVKRWPVAEPTVQGRVQAIGFAEGERREVVKGYVKKVTLELSAQIEGGMSGGIIIDASGRAVGIITHQVMKAGSPNTSQGSVLVEALAQLE